MRGSPAFTRAYRSDALSLPHQGSRRFDGSEAVPLARRLTSSCKILCTDGRRYGVAWNASGEQMEHAGGVLVRGKASRCLPKRLSASPTRHHNSSPTHFLHMAFPHCFAPFYLNTSFDCMLFMVLCFCIKLEFLSFFSFFFCTVVVIPLYLNHFFSLFGYFFPLLSCPP